MPILERQGKREVLRMVVEEIPINLRHAAQDIRRATSDSKLLESRWDSLARRHKDRWVGVYKKKFLYADSLTELIRKARAKDWDVNSMVVARLELRRGAILLRHGGNSGLL